MSDWNAQLIATLRANHGEVPDGPMAGRPLLILTSKGAKTGELKVLRGGAWGYGATFLRWASRLWNGPGDRNRYIGFRCAREVPSP